MKKMPVYFNHRACTQVLLGVAQSLLSGPGITMFLRPNALDPSAAQLKTGELMAVTSQLADEIIALAKAKCDWPDELNPELEILEAAIIAGAKREKAENEAKRHRAKLDARQLLEPRKDYV